MSESKKPVTGYSVCQEMVAVAQTEIAHVRMQQKMRSGGKSFAGPVQSLGRTISALQAEIRKTGDAADDAVDQLPPERQVQLILRMIHDLSPEHRVVVQLYCEELGGKLL